MVSDTYYEAILLKLLLCVDIQPVLSRSPTQFAYFYPEPIIEHDVSTQADMFLASSSPKQAEGNEDDSRDLMVTTLSYNEDT